MPDASGREWSARSVRGREQEDASEDGGAAGKFICERTHVLRAEVTRERKEERVRCTRDVPIRRDAGEEKSNARGKRLDGRGGGILSREVYEFYAESRERFLS